LGNEKTRFQISVKSEEPITKWRINILDASGTLVRTVAGKGRPPATFEWDGRNAAGELVPQNDYSINVEVTDDDDLTGGSTPAAVAAKWVPKKVPFSYTYGVPGDLLFASGKTDLMQSGYDVIQKAAMAIRMKFPNSIIQIAGHTDNVRVNPKAAYKDNQELSLLRAQSVMAYLVSTGMNANLLSAIGYGDTKPIASNDTAEGKAKNRRVELVVSGTVEVTADDLIQAGQQQLAQKDVKGALTDFLKAIESDSRKAAFLTEAARQLAAPVSVLNARIETAKTAPAPLVTARALAPLDRLIGLALPHLAPGGVCLFPKGRTASDELTAASSLWQMDVERYGNAGDPGACILKLGNIHHVGSAGGK